jgi:hypothetical protein
MNKTPKSGAYLIIKNKPTTASFLLTSDDRPTGKEGYQDRPLSLNIPKLAPTTAVVSSGRPEIMLEPDVSSRLSSWIRS